MKRFLICLSVLILVLTGCENNKYNINNGSNKTNKNEPINNKKDAYDKKEAKDTIEIKDINGLKTYTVYEGRKELYLDNIEDSDIYEVRLILTEEGYYMDHGSFAGNVSIGTYNIDNNKLVLNQNYIKSTDCETKKEEKTYTFTIKDSVINASFDSAKNIYLKETKERFGYSILFVDSCEVKIENSKDIKFDKSIYAYNDLDYEIELQFLPFNNYLLTYCNTKNCYSSVGTYSYDSENIVLNQTKYQGSDVCYYYQNKEYKLSYTKSNINNNKIENFDSIIINLKDNEGFTNKDLVLKEDVKTYLDTLYYSEDFFGVYCGRK